MAAAISEILLKNSKSSTLLHSVRPSISVAKYSSSSGDGPKKPIATPKSNSYFDPTMSGLKKGTGGRSSFNGIVATVFGATGLIGERVCNRLGKTGTQLIIPYRGTDYDCRHIKLVGDLGQVLFQPFNLRDEDSIRKAVKYSNVVINLIGRDWETRNYTFKDINVTAARTIARISREAGVKRLVHFSSLNASSNPTPVILSEGSKFLKTKYEGELEVLDEFPNATIIRPSDVYGQGDRFLKYYAQFMRRNLFSIPLWEKGLNTIKQPVFVGDVATGLMNALRDTETAGKILDFAGPKRYVLNDLVDYIIRVLRRDDLFGFGLKIRDLKYAPLFQLRVSLMDKYSFTWPIASLGWDKMERDHTTDTLTGNLTLEDLGVTPTEVESRIDWEIGHYKRALYYQDDLGEFPIPHPPKTVPLNNY